MSIALFAFIFIIEILCAYPVAQFIVPVLYCLYSWFPLILQEEELEKMAALMNAQFQEIDKVDLVVE